MKRAGGLGSLGPFVACPSLARPYLAHQAVDAVRYLHSGASAGKVVLQLAPELPPPGPGGVAAPAPAQAPARPKL